MTSKIVIKLELSLHQAVLLYFDTCFCHKFFVFRKEHKNSVLFLFVALKLFPY